MPFEMASASPVSNFQPVFLLAVLSLSEQIPDLHVACVKMRWFLRLHRNRSGMGCVWTSMNMGVLLQTQNARRCVSRYETRPWLSRQSQDRSKHVVDYHNPVFVWRRATTRCSRAPLGGRSTGRWTTTATTRRHTPTTPASPTPTRQENSQRTIESDALQSLSNFFSILSRQSKDKRNAKLFWLWVS
eukprot:COSAG06_NODE_262_length_18897_cov_122.542877_8_plen_187_part_00